MEWRTHAKDHSHGGASLDDASVLEVEEGGGHAESKQTQGARVGQLGLPVGVGLHCGGVAARKKARMSEAVTTSYQEQNAEAKHPFIRLLDALATNTAWQTTAIRLQSTT